MLISFTGGLTIYSHNQLYGRWITTLNHELPKTNRQIRLSIATPKGTAWLLSASEIEVLDQEGKLHHRYLSKLGPDPIKPEITIQTLTSYWSKASFSKRNLAALMLDQSFLAGVGNYLRSEILFLSGLNPYGKLPADRLSLASNSIKLFRQSYQTRGITNDLELADKLKLQGVEQKDYRFMVFRREGKACYSCHSPIRKDTMAGRSLFWCPTCQKTR